MPKARVLGGRRGPDRPGRDRGPSGRPRPRRTSARRGDRARHVHRCRRRGRARRALLRARTRTSRHEALERGAGSRRRDELRTGDRLRRPPWRDDSLNLGDPSRGLNAQRERLRRAPRPACRDPSPSSSGPALPAVDETGRFRPAARPAAHRSLGREPRAGHARTELCRALLDRMDAAARCQIPFSVRVRRTRCSASPV